MIVMVHSLYGKTIKHCGYPPSLVQILRKPNAPYVRRYWHKPARCRHDADYRVRDRIAAFTSLSLLPIHQRRRDRYNSRPMYLRKLADENCGCIRVPQELHVTRHREKPWAIGHFICFWDKCLLYQLFCMVSRMITMFLHFLKIKWIWIS